MLDRQVHQRIFFAHARINLDGQGPVAWLHLGLGLDQSTERGLTERDHTADISSSPEGKIQFVGKNWTQVKKDILNITLGSLLTRR